MSVREGGVPQSQVLSQASGSRSFPRVPVPGSFPVGTTVLAGGGSPDRGYPSAGTGVPSPTGTGVPPLHPRPGLGYPHPRQVTLRVVRLVRFPAGLSCLNVKTSHMSFSHLGPKLNLQVLSVSMQR